MVREGFFSFLRVNAVRYHGQRVQLRSSINIARVYLTQETRTGAHQVLDPRHDNQ